MNTTAYVILRDNNSDIIDQAGSSSDKFADNKNYTFTNCGSDNLPVANWTDLGVGNGTPGVVTCDFNNDVTTEIYTTTQPTAADISSLEANYTNVFKFITYDYK